MERQENRPDRGGRSAVNPFMGSRFTGSGFSTAAGLKSGQPNRKKETLKKRMSNHALAWMNVEGMYSIYFIKK
jgi:hypothetical protein